FAVDVDSTLADEPAERHAAIHGELDRQTGGRADRDEQRTAGDGGLLDELEREPPADAEDGAREGKQPRTERPADHLVHRVVAADVLAQAPELAALVEETGRVQPARRRERRL